MGKQRTGKIKLTLRRIDSNKIETYPPSTPD